MDDIKWLALPKSMLRYVHAFRFCFSVLRACLRVIVRVFVYVHLCVCVRVNVCMTVYLCVRVYVCVCVCV